MSISLFAGNTLLKIALCVQYNNTYQFSLTIQIECERVQFCSVLLERFSLDCRKGLVLVLVLVLLRPLVG